MTHPYRSADPSDIQTVDIETNDVEAIVYYLDIDGQVKKTEMTFRGTPTAKHNEHFRSPLEYPNGGSGKFNDWIRASWRDGCYILDKTLLIPIHRLLKIERTIKERTARVEVEKENG